MFHHLLQLLNWYTKGLLARIHYHIMGNPNVDFIFNQGGEASLGKFVLYEVDITCQNKAVVLAEDIFVDYVEWHKSTTMPFHEFLVFYVNECQQPGKTLCVSVIIVDRCVAEKDSNGPEQKKNKSESTIHGKPLQLNFFEGGKRTSSPYCPPIPKATGTPALLCLSQSVHNLSSPSNQLPTGDNMCFSLDRSDEFTRLWSPHEICHRPFINGEYLSVTQLAVLGSTTHNYHRSYDIWCYQCYWFADTMYNTIKILVKKAASTSQEPHRKGPVYREGVCRPAVNSGSFQWPTKMATSVTQSDPETNRAIYQRFKNAMESMKVRIAEEKERIEANSLAPQLKATQEELAKEKVEKEKLERVAENAERMAENAERVAEKEKVGREKAEEEIRKKLKAELEQH